MSVNKPRPATNPDPRRPLPPTAVDIARWLRLVVADGDVLELRILNIREAPRYSPFVASGYFDDMNALAQAAMEWTPKAEGCFTTVNPVLPELLARANNRVIPKPRFTTTDRGILRRTGMIFSVHPDVLSGISSSDGEKAEARCVVDRLVAELTLRGWPRPVLGDAGNSCILM